MLFGKVFYKKCRGEIIARNASGGIVLLIKAKREKSRRRKAKGRRLGRYANRQLRQTKRGEIFQRDGKIIFSEKLGKLGKLDFNML